MTTGPTTTGANDNGGNVTDAGTYAAHPRSRAARSHAHPRNGKIRTAAQFSATSKILAPSTTIRDLVEPAERGLVFSGSVAVARHIRPGPRTEPGAFGQDAHQAKQFRDA